MSPSVNIGALPDTHTSNNSEEITVSSQLPVADAPNTSKEQVDNSWPRLFDEEMMNGGSHQSNTDDCHSQPQQYSLTTDSSVGQASAALNALDSDGAAYEFDPSVCAEHTESEGSKAVVNTDEREESQIRYDAVLSSNDNDIAQVNILTNNASEDEASGNHSEDEEGDSRGQDYQISETRRRFSMRLEEKSKQEHSSVATEYKSKKRTLDEDCDTWIEIPEQEPKALCYASEDDLRAYFEENERQQEKKKRVKSKVLRERSTNCQETGSSKQKKKSKKGSIVLRRSGRRSQEIELRKDNKRTSASGDSHGYRIDFPHTIDQVTRETLQHCLSDKDRIQEGDDLALLLDCFVLFDEPDFGNLSRSERIDDLSKHVNFCKVNGMRNSLTVLQKRALLWCGGIKLPKSVSGLTPEQAEDAILYIVDAVEEHEPDNRWEALLRRRPMKVKNQAKLVSKFSRLIDKLLKTVKEGDLVL